MPKSNDTGARRGPSKVMLALALICIILSAACLFMGLRAEASRLILLIFMGVFLFLALVDLILAFRRKPAAHTRRRPPMRAPDAQPEKPGEEFSATAPIKAENAPAGKQDLTKSSATPPEPQSARPPKRAREYPSTMQVAPLDRRPAILVGKIHGIGARSYQQDCLAEISLGDDSNKFAIVADGMGGLTDSGEVSQRIVEKALELAAGIKTVTAGNPLVPILSTVTDDINRMLGPDKIYKSGSTIVAAAVIDNRLQWISVGDSRLYLYRQGYLSRINRDHDLLQDWMPEILAGKRNYLESEANPDSRKLTSFIGMGALRYVDQSLQSIRLYPGDRLLLMSDGIYGSVPEAKMCEILKREPDVVHAAQDIGEQLRLAAVPHQDNFSLVILGIQAERGR